MASRIAKRVAFRDVPAIIPQLSKLQLTLSAASAPGAVGARRIQQILLPAIRYWNPEAAVEVSPPPARVRRGKEGAAPAATEQPTPKLVASFADGKTREFDPAKEHPLSIIADLLAMPRTPKAPAEVPSQTSGDVAVAAPAEESADVSAAPAKEDAAADAEKKASAEKAESELPPPPKSLPDPKLKLWRPAKWMGTPQLLATTADLLKTIPQLKPVFKLRPPTRRQGNGAYKVVKRKKAARTAWIARLKAKIDAEQSVL